MGVGWSCIRELADTLDDWERYKGIPLEPFRSDRDSRNDDPCDARIYPVLNRYDHRD